MTFKGKIVDKPYPFGLKNITFSSKYVCIVFFLLLFLLSFFFILRAFQRTRISSGVHCRTVDMALHPVTYVFQRCMILKVLGKV